MKWYECTAAIAQIAHGEGKMVNIQSSVGQFSVKHTIVWSVVEAELLEHDDVHYFTYMEGV